MPFPSVGCQTCKSRRVKCDERQPVCQKCTKSNRICSWKEAGLLIHGENLYASGQFKRPRGPRSVKIAHYNPSAILHPPSADLRTVALSSYMSRHVRTPEEAPNILKGLEDDFLPLWSSAVKSPAILDFAVTSIALAAFSRTREYPPAAVVAATKYDQLLRIAQVTIPSLDQGNIDACLLAIFFMSRYENIVHHPGHHSSFKVPLADALRSFSHDDGAMAILKLWHHRLSRRQPATDVIKHTRRWLIKSALLRNNVIPRWMEDGASFGEQGVELEYYRILIRITHIRHRVSVLRGKIGGPKAVEQVLKSAAVSLAREAEHVDKALQNWISDIFDVSCQCRHTVTTWEAQGLLSSTIYTYLNPANAAVWVQYYSVRMLMNSTLLRILELIGLSSTTVSQYLECTWRITTMADDLASSLPYFLERVRITEGDKLSSCQEVISLNKNENVKPCMADLAVWPLTIVSSLADLDKGQRLWFRNQLASVGRMIGDKVLEVANADEWFPL